MNALLSSLKILDFATLLPGPAATMILADLGANVLRVESATRPDLLRVLPPYVIKEKRYSYYHAFINRCKKSITLDLKNKESLPIIEKLVKEYDIVVEQFRPGVMKRLGLGYEDLKKINPKIIYCSLTGYGQTGPLKDRAGHDINYLSLAGIMSYSGRKKQVPNTVGIQIADVGGGSYNTVVGILAAVVNRMVTGKGQYIDVSMFDCLFPYQGIASSREFTDEDSITYENDRLNGGSLYDYYETSDGRYISFGGIEPQFFNNFCDVIGLPELKARGIDQTGCVEESKKKVSERIKSQTREYWVKKFEGIDVCLEPVLTFAEAIESEHVKSRELIVEVPGPDGIKVRQPAMPIKFSDYSPDYSQCGCALGEHNVEIMKSIGYTDSQIAEIKSKGVFGPA